MHIRKWSGLLTAASPYALPPGAAAEQNNLQIRKPGQLVPRPGMTALDALRTGTVLALHRQSPGGSVADRLFRFDEDVYNATTGLYRYALYVLIESNGTLNSTELKTFDVAPRLYPSFAQDRHGSVYVFYGNDIRPMRYLHGTDTQAVSFGIDAPTVAPVVAPEGDGWFIERVDVLSSGTSYYTPPTLTVSGGSPGRNATLRAVVQAGAIVAVDVVDGGSNFKDVPTITVSNEQVGVGFFATGTRATAAAVYGFKDTTAQASTYPQGSLTAGNTHSFDLSTSEPKIAYLSGATTVSANATYNSVTGEYTALIPLTPSAGNGTAAFAEVKFDPISAAYKVGNAAIDYSPAGSTAATASGGVGSLQFRYHRNNWYTSDDYYNNTVTPVNANYTDDKWKYHSAANKDAFWAMMPNPNSRKFAKRQIERRWWTDGDFFNSGYHTTRYGNYYYPDYGRVGYRLLIGPQDRLDVPANWIVGSAEVQVSSGRPYIDVQLQPAKKADGTARQINANTVNPTVRIFLKYCPDSWVVDNTAPLSNNNVEAKDRRYTPQSGQDRRDAQADTGTSQTNSNPSGVMDFYFFSGASNAAKLAADTRKRWWNVGHVNNSAAAYEIKRPIVDTRTTSGGDTAGTGAGTVELQNAGAQLEKDTVFVLRFEQYNSFDYDVNNSGDSASFSWLTSVPGTPTIAASESSFQKKATFNSEYIDFYFQANVLDATGGDPSLLLPGAIKSSKVVLTGKNWASGQYGEFVLRQRTTTPTLTPSFSSSVTARWNTELIEPAVTASRIESVTIQSQGQNYYREPTILFRGGGGYGLRVQSTVSGGRVTAVNIIDGGDGFSSDTVLYTDVQPAKLLPILRGTMRGVYRCAYRYADYRQTVVLSTTISVTSGSTVATLASATGVQPGMQITGVSQLRHLVRIVSVSGTTVTLSHAASATASTQACVIRDMRKPVQYSDFSPIVDVDASANSSGRASQMVWTLAGASPPARADYVEFFRTSADQSLVFYRLEQYGTVSGGTITIVGSDDLSDEELFDVDRPAYAALPVVLPNGGLNAFRFGIARNDMAVCVAWEDRLWYAVSTSGKDGNTVFFSELDEFESCPDLNELPIQSNLRASDYLTALVPFGPVLLAMQNLHSYSIAYNTDPAVDPVITLASHRGCFNHRTWDIFDDLLYAADERGVYSMSKAGEVKSLSEPIRDYFTDNKLDLSQKATFHLRVDQATGILRLFVCLDGFSATRPHIAFCYHIQNEAWWTETWPNSLCCASDYRPQNGRDKVIYGALDGGIYEFSGLRDYPFSDIVSVTVTNGGSGYITPPTVTTSGDGRGAELRALLTNGVVTEVLVVKGGYGYGVSPDNGSFNSSVALTFSAPPSGTTATGTATARSPNTGTAEAPVFPRSAVPFSIRTGPMALSYEGNAKSGDRLMDRSITVTYRPTSASKTLILREYYNNSSSPRPNVMRRDRGTGFVHETDGAKTTLEMSNTRSALGVSTGLAKAMFSGRSLDDMGTADRHIAIELSCDSADASAGEPPEPLIYELEVRGVEDGG